MGGTSSSKKGDDKPKKGDRGHKCDECDRVFTRNEHLQRHKREVHEGVRPYECPICHLTFAREYDYRVHMRTRHSIEVPQSAYPPHYQSPGAGGSGTSGRPGPAPPAPSHSAAGYYNPAQRQQGYYSTMPQPLNSANTVQYHYSNPGAVIPPQSNAIPNASYIAQQWQIQTTPRPSYPVSPQNSQNPRAPQGGRR